MASSGVDNAASGRLVDDGAVRGRISAGCPIILRVRVPICNRGCGVFELLQVGRIPTDNGDA